jgi:release factor glutamine methyltransferase
VTGCARPAPPESVGRLLDDVERRLAARGVRDARTEAREIVAAVHDAPRFWPSMNGSASVAAAARDRILAAADRRAEGAPLAYAVGRASFRHLTLVVDERVLIPRPETEQLVDLVLQQVADRDGGVAVDVGTGSGAIALALAIEGRFEKVVATDVSLGALDVARENVALAGGLLRAPVLFAHGSALAPVLGLRARVVVSNPPYIACAEAVDLPASVRDWEPPVALFGGRDGLALTAMLVREAADVLEPGGALVLEVDARRAGRVADLLGRDTRYRAVSVHVDLSGRERFVVARR